MYKTILWYSAEKRYTYPKFKATSYAVSRYRAHRKFHSKPTRTRFLPSSNRWESCRAHANKPFETIGIWIITGHSLYYLWHQRIHDRYSPINHINESYLLRALPRTMRVRKYKRPRQFLSPSFPANLLCNMLHYIFTETQFILLDNTHTLLENWIW